jgi:hypothetical protein
LEESLFELLFAGGWDDSFDILMASPTTSCAPPVPRLSSPWASQFPSGANIHTEFFEETKPYQIEDFFKYSEKYRNATKGNVDSSISHFLFVMKYFV